MPYPPKIDLVFPIRGREVPLDHGYALYAALCGALECAGDPWLHDRQDVGVHPIRGHYVGPGRLVLTGASRVSIRLPVDLVYRCLGLAGRSLVLGSDRLQLGIPVPKALQPHASLYSHLVTTRNGHDEARFDDEVARQLDELEIEGLVTRASRRTYTVKGRRLVGYSVFVRDLTADASLRLQAEGLGGRRKFGCGIFLPSE